ncbi:UBP1-associated protein 2B-like [Triticum urartu]|uniref:UBP1-associated protein 2B-like n=1 Tax=Triticum urartu TaxID=4572 RepID=UPI002043C367|nr:UBP1-associated protein 2B-like [Triticum urartu]
MRMLTYGIAADSADDYIRSAEATNLEACKKFVIKICEVFGDQYRCVCWKPGSRGCDKARTRGRTNSATNPQQPAADECKEEEIIEGLPEPFSRDELLDVLVQVRLRDPTLLSRLATSAASDAAHRRLYIHGLSPSGTSAALAAAFVPFGVLDGCHAVADRATGRCRGYGFIILRRCSSRRRALADSSKRVGGRPIACQFASVGPAGPSPGGTGRKLLVDRVPARTSIDELRRFFSEFGEIEAGSLVADHATGQFCGYATFLYKSPEGIAKGLEEPRKVFDGCELHCRHAQRQTKRKCATAAPEDTGCQINVTRAAAFQFPFRRRYSQLPPRSHF